MSWLINVSVTTASTQPILDTGTDYSGTNDTVFENGNGSFIQRDLVRETHFTRFSSRVLSFLAVNSIPLILTSGEICGSRTVVIIVANECYRYSQNRHNLPFARRWPSYQRQQRCAWFFLSTNDGDSMSQRVGLPASLSCAEKIENTDPPTSEIQYDLRFARIVMFVLDSALPLFVRMFD